MERDRPIWAELSAAKIAHLHHARVPPVSEIDGAVRAMEGQRIHLDTNAASKIN